MQKLVVVATCVFGGLLVAGPSQVWARTARDQIDSLLNKHHEGGEFNGVVLVADHGHVVYHDAFGISSADGRTDLIPESSFRLASVAKAFTGMAIMLLHESGQLNYDDDVREFLDGFPYEGVSVRHLLHHTSGLPDYVRLMNEHWDVENKGTSDRRFARSPDALAMLIKHRPPVRFQPGERWEYSNTGYVVLATDR